MINNEDERVDTNNDKADRVVEGQHNTACEPHTHEDEHGHEHTHSHEAREEVEQVCQFCQKILQIFVCFINFKLYICIFYFLNEKKGTNLFAIFSSHFFLNK